MIEVLSDKQSNVNLRLNFFIWVFPFPNLPLASFSLSDIMWHDIESLVTHILEKKSKLFLVRENLQKWSEFDCIWGNLIVESRYKEKPNLYSELEHRSEPVLINKSAKMFMTKKQRDAIYENLFREGVMVAEKICKRTQGRMHPDVTSVSNLLVIKVSFNL